MAVLAGGALWPASARAGASAAPDVELPATFRGGRPFLALRASDGTKVLAWLDTAGSGFIAKALADRLRLRVSAGRARLPEVREQLPALNDDGSLPVIDADAKDPILRGVDVQLGGSWFAGRVWTIDYRNMHITWHADGRAVNADAVNPVRMIFPRGPYPVIPVVVEGEIIRMSLDTAASVVERAGNVTATSFITRARFAQWHGARPDWGVRSIGAGVDAIEVPEVRVGDVPLGSVSFTTRPDDDVFEGETVAGKLGSNAWAFRILNLDYVRGVAAFD